MNVHPLQSVKGIVWHKAKKKTPCVAERAHVIQSGVCAAKNPIPSQATLAVACIVKDAHVLQRSSVLKGRYCIWNELLLVAKRAYGQ